MIEYSWFNPKLYIFNLWYAKHILNDSTSSICSTVLELAVIYNRRACTNSLRSCDCNIMFSLWCHSQTTTKLYSTVLCLKHILSVFRSSRRKGVFRIYTIYDISEFHIEKLTKQIKRVTKALLSNVKSVWTSNNMFIYLWRG